MELSWHKVFTLVSQSFVELKISPLPESYILLAEMPLELDWDKGVYFPLTNNELVLLRFRGTFWFVESLFI